MKVLDRHWCEVGRNKRRFNENPRHISFYYWGYDECPICGKVLKVVFQ